MKTVSLKTIEQSEKVGLYSICFDGNDLTEYEKFVQKFLNDATLNKDFQRYSEPSTELWQMVLWKDTFVQKADSKTT